jgi:choline dehydrogenase-like flavoprotein
MFAETAELSDGDTVTADVCIVGGGLAGIALASTLLDTETRVVLLESGVIGPSVEADHLSDGFSTGHPYFPLSEGAPRRLGGAADVWGAWCRPLDPTDFEERDWRWSGWPLTFEELAPYYEQARQFLKLSERGFAGSSWTDGLPPLYRHIQESTSLDVGVWQESPLAPLTEVFVGSLEAADNLTVFLGATALDIQLREASAAAAATILVAGLDGNRFRVEADHFVLAGGALGVARLLLASDRQQPAGVGNDHGMVGRFFAEHPHVVAGRIAVSRPAAAGRRRFAAVDRGVGGVLARIEMERPRSGIRAGILLAEDVRRREGLLNAIAHLRPPSVEPPRAALEFFRAVRHRNIRQAARGIPDLLRHLPEVLRVVYRRLLKRPRELELYVQAETSPNPQSRVVLSAETDAYGMRRPELQWRIAARDKELLVRSVELMASELESIGLGTLQLEPWVTDPGEAWCVEPFGGMHLMGTTRMSVLPEEGVVDAQGRVHGFENLWIVGPSVFPSYGSANPGMTIVATALWTADHLNQTLPRAVGDAVA